MNRADLIKIKRNLRNGMIAMIIAVVAIAIKFLTGLTPTTTDWVVFGVAIVVLILSVIVFISVSKKIDQVR